MRANSDFFNSLEQEIREAEATDSERTDNMSNAADSHQEVLDLTREQEIDKATPEILAGFNTRQWNYITNRFKKKYIEKIIRRIPDKSSQHKFLDDIITAYVEQYREDYNEYPVLQPWMGEVEAKIDLGRYLQDPLPELEEHTDEAMMGLLRKYKSDMAQLREAMNKALDESEKDKVIEEQAEKLEEYKKNEGEIAELRKRNEELIAENERLKKGDDKPDDETVRRSHYCEFLLHFMEAGKGMKDKAAIGLFLQTATRPEKWLPTEIDDEIAHFHEREQFDAAALASVLAKGGINIQQLNMGNGTQGLLPSTLLPSTDNEKK